MGSPFTCNFVTCTWFIRERIFQKLNLVSTTQRTVLLENLLVQDARCTDGTRQGAPP